MYFPHKGWKCLLWGLCTSIGAVGVMLHSARVSNERLLFGWSMGSREGSVLGRFYVLLLISLKSYHA